MRLDPINGIRDGLPIDLEQLNTFISDASASTNSIAQIRNDVIDNVTVLEGITHILPRTMAENIGIVLISQSNDTTLYIPLSKFMASVNNGVFINHSLFPSISAFYVNDSAKSAQATTSIGSDNIRVGINGELSTASDTQFILSYSVTSNEYFDTLLVMFGNDARFKVTVSYDENLDTAEATNAFIYKFPYKIKSASFSFNSPKMNSKYIAAIDNVMAGNATIGTSFGITTAPYTALIPNAKYKADLICTVGKSSTFSLGAINGNNSTDILSITNGVRNASTISNHRKSYETNLTLSDGAATTTASFNVDEASTYALLSGDAYECPTKFSFDEDGNMYSYIVVDGSVQVPATLNATFYDTSDKRVYNTLNSGIYKVVYSPDSQSDVYALFDKIYASMVDVNSVVIDGSNITVSIDEDDSTVALADMIDKTYTPSGIQFADTSSASLSGDGVELFGCDVFTSTTYTFNGTMMDILLPVTALADTNANLTALIKANDTFISVEDGQFLYSEDSGGNKYVLCRIDTTKHQELVGVSDATVYAIAAPRYSSKSNTSASATFKGDNIVYGMILRGNANVSVFVDGSNVYSGKLKEYIHLGATPLKKVSIIADATIGVSFVAPTDLRTKLIYAPSLKKLSSISTSASSYTFTFLDADGSLLATYTQADTVNLNTNVNPMFIVSTSDINAVQDAALLFTYIEPNVYVSTKEFIGYETEIFNVSASFDGIGFVPSATAIVVTSVR